MTTNDNVVSPAPHSYPRYTQASTSTATPPPPPAPVRAAMRNIHIIGDQSSAFSSDIGDQLSNMPPSFPEPIARRHEVHESPEHSRDACDQEPPPAPLDILTPGELERAVESSPEFCKVLQQYMDDTGSKNVKKAADYINNDQYKTKGSPKREGRGQENDEFVLTSNQDGQAYFTLRDSPDSDQRYYYNPDTGSYYAMNDALDCDIDRKSAQSNSSDLDLIDEQLYETMSAEGDALNSGASTTVIAGATNLSSDIFKNFFDKEPTDEELYGPDSDEIIASATNLCPQPMQLRHETQALQLPCSDITMTEQQSFHLSELRIPIGKEVDEALIEMQSLVDHTQDDMSASTSIAAAAAANLASETAHSTMKYIEMDDVEMLEAPLPDIHMEDIANVSLVNEPNLLGDTIDQQEELIKPEDIKLEEEAEVAAAAGANLQITDENYTYPVDYNNVEIKEEYIEEAVYYEQQYYVTGQEAQQTEVEVVTEAPIVVLDDEEIKDEPLDSFPMIANPYASPKVCYYNHPYHCP